MTREEFITLPYLLTPGQVASCGYSSATVAKYAECGVLRVILPAGCTQRRFQKRQVALLNGWEATLDLAGWRRLKPMVRLGVVCQWTGYDRDVIGHMVAAGALTVVQPAGVGYRLFRTEEIGAWLGLDEIGGQNGKLAVKCGQSVVRSQPPAVKGMMR